MMREYEVRCCCQPQKVLGWLQWKDGAKSGDKVVVGVNVSQIDDDRISYEYLEVEFRSFIQIIPRLTELQEVALEEIESVAVYSDDRPLEFWRGIPAFKEKYSA